MASWCVRQWREQINGRSKSMEQGAKSILASKITEKLSLKLNDSLVKEIKKIK